MAEVISRAHDLVDIVQNWQSLCIDLLACAKDASILATSHDLAELEGSFEAEDMFPNDGPQFSWETRQ